jgi:hypothetical protein
LAGIRQLKLHKQHFNLKKKKKKKKMALNQKKAGIPLHKLSQALGLSDRIAT